ncbi:MAG TPA: ATPase [Porphyromonadaceae bacterium]|jgi:hypothetical protein|nr:ATPase [Porphyromonadaceae bacterium]
MDRTAIEQLIEWKERKNRKPLVVRGARQVGKTWLLKEFSKLYYEKTVYINFEKNELAKRLFEQDFDIWRILRSVSLMEDVDIDEQTLLIFDEIQEAPRGITSLKYFYEDAPQYQIIAAGSLLGISMHQKDSFPVGKVDFMDLYPLSFHEYLLATGNERFTALLKEKDWETITLFKEKLTTLLKEYFFIGGMPEVVDSFVRNVDFNEVRRLQLQILDAYDRDFSKHAPISEVPRIRMVWKSIHGQLTKENKKFIYGMIKEGARAREFELAIEWLLDAGLIYKILRIKKGEMPLSGFVDFAAFKLYLLDTGLFCAMGNLPAKILIEGNLLFSQFKGAVTEQYVLQQLIARKLYPYYWSSENSKGEVDFIIQHEDTIVPIEVKAEENLQSKSLRAFIHRYPALHGVRFSMSDFRQQEWMTNYPLYALPYVI